GRPPTDDEIVKHSKLAPKHVAEVRAAARAVTSLDRPVGEEGDTTYGDLFAVEGSEPVEEVHVSLAETAVRHAVEALPDREKEVVKLRYGMDGDPDPKSLEEIGRIMGLTRDRVRQIEAQALPRRAARRVHERTEAEADARVWVDEIAARLPGGSPHQPRARRRSARSAQPVARAVSTRGEGRHDRERAERRGVFREHVARRRAAA